MKFERRTVLVYDKKSPIDNRECVIGEFNVQTDTFGRSLLQIFPR
jgi:hypothetical protein